VRLYPLLGRKIAIFQCLQGNVKGEAGISPRSPPRLHRRSFQHPPGQQGASSPALPSRPKPRSARAAFVPGQAFIQRRSSPEANGACVPRLLCSVAEPALFTLSYLGGGKKKYNKGQALPRRHCCVISVTAKPPISSLGQELLQPLAWETKGIFFFSPLMALLLWQYPAPRLRALSGRCHWPA